MNETITFSFGKNWQAFIGKLDDARVAAAERSLTDFIGVPDLRGRTFLDVGCGSGLFSLAAHRLGADRITSFDADPRSVACCRTLRERAGDPGNWDVCERSILDPDIRGLGRFDIVYAWGVLHHTGDMWRAILNTADLVADGGYLYLALYNKVPGRTGSSFWLRVKRLYNRTPWLGKKAMEAAYVGKFLVDCAVQLRNPVTFLRKHRAKRGMSFWSDIPDWLGGYPYEYASAGEVFRFFRAHAPEFDLENLRTSSDYGNNSFLFRRRSPDRHG